MMNEHWYKTRLKENNLRITEERQLVLSVLSHNVRKHLTVEEIYLQAHDAKPSIGMSTVYRAVNLFVEFGIINKLEFGEGKARYELIPGPRKPDHHHHLICKKCQKVLNYDDFIEAERQFLEIVESGLQQRYHFRIDEHIIQFYGYCEDCMKGNF